MTNLERLNILLTLTDNIHDGEDERVSVLNLCLKFDRHLLKPNCRSMKFNDADKIKVQAGGPNFTPPPPAPPSPETRQSWLYWIVCFKAIGLYIFFLIKPQREICQNTVEIHCKLKFRQPEFVPKTTLRDSI